MTKKLILFLLFLLAIASLVGYVDVSNRITSGSTKIAEGQKQIDEGEQALAAGKAKLANGKRKLSQSKSFFNNARLLTYVAAPELIPISGLAFKGAGQQIAAGNQKVAEGSKKIAAGEEELAAGKQQLIEGKDRLAFANKIRIALGISVIIFTLLFIILGFCWRRSLFKRK